MKNTVSEINRAAQNARTFINECEKNYHEEIMELARYICKNKHIKIIMIAGPSGSGKTTTAHILKEYIKDTGVNARTVSLDNFYLDRESLPVLASGEADTESVNSLDLNCIQKSLLEIIKNGMGFLPRYDFKIGKRIENAEKIDIRDGGIIIVEGLHALNPVITDMLPRESLYKIYISVSAGIFDNGGNAVLSSRKIRFIRRTLRDEKFRNADINTTMKMWPLVISGEENYLYPFKPCADKVLVTLHPYELCVYKGCFLEMMETAERENPLYSYAEKIASVLRQLCSIDASAVPYGSLIREFIGGGKYNN